jgi:hypothetical protein
MFAKPNWFCTKTFGRRLSPVDWRGWLYVVGVAAVALLPVLILLGRRQGLEALIWLAAVGAFAFYDLWQVRRVLTGGCSPKGAETRPTEVRGPATQQPPAADDGIYFLDQCSGQQPVNTTRFQLSLKQ